MDLPAASLASDTRRRRPKRHPRKRKRRCRKRRQLTRQLPPPGRSRDGAGAATGAGAGGSRLPLPSFHRRPGQRRRRWRPGRVTCSWRDSSNVGVGLRTGSLVIARLCESLWAVACDLSNKGRTDFSDQSLAYEYRTSSGFPYIPSVVAAKAGDERCKIASRRSIQGRNIRNVAAGTPMPALRIEELQHGHSSASTTLGRAGSVVVARRVEGRGWRAPATDRQRRNAGSGVTGRRSRRPKAPGGAAAAAANRPGAPQSAASSKGQSANPGRHQTKRRVSPCDANAMPRAVRRQNRHGTRSCAARRCGGRGEAAVMSPSHAPSSQPAAAHSSSTARACALSSRHLGADRRADRQGDAAAARRGRRRGRTRR